MDGKDKEKKKYKYLYAFIYGIVLTAFCVYVLLDTFVVEKPLVKVSVETKTAQASVTTEPAAQNSVLTEDSYTDDNMSVTVSTARYYNTTVYIADIQVASVSYLKTAFARDTYGRNIKQTTSEIAEAKNAVLAINGDYYGFSDDGFVLRNGTVYRDTPTESDEDEALCIYGDGGFEIINERSSDINELAENGAYQILSFGPALVKDSTVSVDANSEVGKSMASNPRTAVGAVTPLHYIFVVSDGRTDESEGLSLYELAGIMQELGCATAYNLDGGGSSTMWFNGNVINNPTTNGNISERKVSDIVYIGY